MINGSIQQQLDSATAMILNLCYKIYLTTVPGLCDGCADGSFGVGDCDDCCDRDDDDRCCHSINIFKDQLHVKS